MKVLVLFAHPAQQHSVANKALCAAATATADVTFVDLYAKYPRLNIDVDAEQQLLLDHDAIVFQFPLMWYSTPAILKEWMDLVLEYDFAYGQNGVALRDKIWINAVTAGSGEQAYSDGGHVNFSLPELLSPLNATANLCKMKYLAPYTIFSAMKPGNQAKLAEHCAGYQALLNALVNDQLNIEAAGNADIIDAKSITTMIEAST